MGTTKSERKKYVEKWQVSGLSASEFCRKKWLNYGTFMSWRNQSRQMDTSSTNTGAFIDLGQREDECKIHLPNGVRIDHKGPLDEQLLRILCNV